jgi:hypothetical protein
MHGAANVKIYMDGLEKRNTSVVEFQICHFQSVALTPYWLKCVIFLSNFKVEIMDFSGHCEHQMKSSQHYSGQSVSRVRTILFWGKLNNLETGKLCRGFHAFRSYLFQMIFFCLNVWWEMLVQKVRRKALPSKSEREWIKLMWLLKSFRRGSEVFNISGPAELPNKKKRNHLMLLIYLLNAFGLTPGGSSTIHI